MRRCRGWHTVFPECGCGRRVATLRSCATTDAVTGPGEGAAVSRRRSWPVRSAALSVARTAALTITLILLLPGIPTPAQARTESPAADAASAEPVAPSSGESAALDRVPDAATLVAQAIDQTRGLSSFAELEMRVHRPDWERTSAIVAWTRGRDDALIRFTGPPRDAGNATLKQGDQMWTFTPRLNRVVRLPYSMMSQSWAGSDFSYDDLSRTDALLRHYTHRMLDVREADGHVLYTIESTPTADAPVVWGRQTLVLRDDRVMLEQVWYDQDDVALKRMETLEIGELGGRLIPVRMRMGRLDATDEWTEVIYHDADFDVDIPDRRFTLHALREAGRME